MFLLFVILQKIIYESENNMFLLDTDTKTAAITGRFDPTIPLQIPSTITSPTLGEFEVTEIGSKAFSNDQNFNTPVKIPSTVKIIGDKAFYNSSIESIEFSEGLVTIGSQAFYNCVYLSSPLTFPQSLQIIGRGAFFDCLKLTSVSLNEGLEKILPEAFQGCLSLSGELKFPSTLKVLEMFSFKNCYLLTSINFGTNSVLSVYKQSFDGCFNIEKFSISGNKDFTTDSYGAFYKKKLLMNIPCTVTSFMIPKDVEYISDNAFEFTSKLTVVTVEKGNSIFEIDSLGALLRKEASTKTLYFVPRNATLFRVDATLGDLKPHALNDCENLNTFTVDHSNNAFTVEAGALILHNRLVAVPRSIKEYDFPERVNSQVSDPFGCCYNLEKITSHPNNQHIRADENGLIYDFKHEILFRVPPALKDVVLPEQLRIIGDNSFRSCINLKTLDVGPNVTQVDTIEFRFTNDLTVKVPSLPTIFSYLPFVKVSVKSNFFGFLKELLKKTDEKGGSFTLVLGCITMVTVAILVVLIVVVIRKKRQNSVVVVDDVPLLQEE
ncbi:hypothetical protein TRFO_09337 [Tritrichomonas foetus]|uniref:Surface antigen BspA-like n=1 Tax=Tritrichomonas foetus TaxID=1144522 RepID=A0A1J4JG36_9EUKA|nr:hypothetical protein TRFO_09337 [Tritrichomonas foetus]|eukprot:OHS97633.1 hypothetical protein TRFO_09337 [Tritrichomonas foetus]